MCSIKLLQKLSFSHATLLPSWDDCRTVCYMAVLYLNGKNLKLSWACGSAIILVFWLQVLIPNSKGNPVSGTQNTQVGKFCDSRLKSPFMLFSLFSWIFWRLQMFLYLFMQHCAQYILVWCCSQSHCWTYSFSRSSMASVSATSARANRREVWLAKAAPMNRKSILLYR